MELFKKYILFTFLSYKLNTIISLCLSFIYLVAENIELAIHIKEISVGVGVFSSGTLLNLK